MRSKIINRFVWLPPELSAEAYTMSAVCVLPGKYKQKKKIIEEC